MRIRSSKRCNCVKYHASLIAGSSYLSMIISTLENLKEIQSYFMNIPTLDYIFIYFKVKWSIYTPPQVVHLSFHTAIFRSLILQFPKFDPFSQ